MGSDGSTRGDPGVSIDFTFVRLEVIRTLKLNGVSELVDLLAAAGLANAAQEEFWVVALDSLNQVRSITTVGVGTYHEMGLSVASVLSPVLLSATDRFIVAHNHPNGRVNPTPDDIALTESIQEAALIMNMAFDDHLIVGPLSNWQSMRSLGHLSDNE